MNERELEARVRLAKASDRLLTASEECWDDQAYCHAWNDYQAALSSVLVLTGEVPAEGGAEDVNT